MSNSTTRIADLPENIKFETREIQQNMQPNHVAIPPPQDTQMRNQFIPTKEQQEMMIPTQPHTLPSRDIPMDQNTYQQDPSVKPNYIPPSNIQDDYFNRLQYKKIVKLQTYIKENIHHDVIIHGSTENRVAHNLMVSLPISCQDHDLLLLKNQ